MTLTPAQIEQRLEDIEHDLGDRQNAYASASEKWHRACREREHQHAVEFMRAAGATVTERKEQARELTALIGITEEAEYEGLRAAIKVMETRAMIGMALLKSAGRA
jgi:hypothetical protein